jgi:predicted NBD/HSP70 family sugar kinase
MKKGTNSLIMRIKNEKAILSMILEKPMSRVEISGAMGLTKAAVSIIVDELIEKGLIAECAADSTGVGRRPLMLSFRGECVFAIGINITREKFYVGIYNFLGEKLSESAHTYDTPEDFFGKIGDITNRMIKDCSISKDSIFGVGVVTPGPVDIERNIILNPPNFDGWCNVAIAEELEKILNCNIFFTSVSRGVAVAEKYFGAAKSSDSFAALLINNDGIGSAIMLGGKLFRGNNEIGHTSIVQGGVKCECGNRGCLEKYASLSAVTKGSGADNWRQAIDGRRTDVIEKEAAYLSSAIINTANIFDIDRFVLCGEVCYGAEFLLGYIKKQTEGAALCGDRLRVTAGTHFPESLIGAAVAVHNFFY